MENINIKLLEHHPRNPRKEIGDVTELADSIKANGIMQNLTVVPHGDKYYVVIGNRRLEAAKLAGLTELPCQVVNMTEKEQQSMMLLENMQRVDLTPYEQAEGFQMCLDLGMDEDELKEKTGFSKKTIRHRIKMLELDSEKLKKSMTKGANIQDYIDLEKINNIEKRNELLEFIGTTDFRYRLNNALSHQERFKVFDEQLPRFQKNMVEVDGRPEGYGYYDYLPTNRMKSFTFPEDGKEYVFVADRELCFIYIYVKYDSHKEKTEECKEPTQDEINVEKIKELVENAYRTRLEFAKEIYETLQPDMKKNIEIKYLFDLENNYLDSYRCDDDKIFKEITGKEIKDVLSIRDTLFESYKNCIRFLFAYIYANLDSVRNDITVNEYTYNNSTKFGSYSDSYKDELQNLYNFLSLYGYEPSEEEKAVMFGTHTLYKKIEE